MENKEIERIQFEKDKDEASKLSRLRQFLLFDWDADQASDVCNVLIEYIVDKKYWDSFFDLQWEEKRIEEFLREATVDTLHDYALWGLSNLLFFVQVLLRIYIFSCYNLIVTMGPKIFPLLCS